MYCKNVRTWLGVDTVASVWLSSLPIEVLTSSLSQITHQCHPMPKRHSANTHSASITNTGDTTNSTPATLESLDLRGSSPFYYPFLWIWRMKIQGNKKDTWHQPHPLPCATFLIFLSRPGSSTGQTCRIPRKTFCEHGAWSTSVKEFLHCIALELWGKLTYIDDQRKFRLRNFRYTNNISVKLSQVEQVK